MGNTLSASGAASASSAFLLPEKAMLRIASFLSVKDIVNVAQTSVMLNAVSCDNKVWRQLCLRVGWGGRITSTHVVRKKWKEVYVQQVMLSRQRRVQAEVAKPAVVRGPKKLHVLLLGLDRSGKSTFVYRIKLGRTIVSIPTVGANREVIVRPLPSSRSGAQLERTFKFTDVGGIAPMRPLWGEYLKDVNKVDVFAFMVDASDQERVPQAAVELGRCLNMIGPSKPVIVLANKFDVHRAFSAHQLAEKMKLRELFEANKKKQPPLWCCQSVSNVTGQGIAEALDWMVWSLSPTADDECWFCRSQEVDEAQLVVCKKCNHRHCPSCMAGKASLCKFCFYCTHV